MPLSGLNEGLIATVLTTLGALVGGVSTYLIKRRASSGTIQTTEAQALWTEASAFRAVQRDTIAEQAQTIDRLEDQVKALREENGRLWAENQARRSRA